MSTEAREDIASYFHELARRTSTELWKVARREPNVANLVFPNQRDTELHRVSEQESRCIAQRLIAESGYHFSIETPTVGTFKFSGKETTNSRAAQHDLSLYRACTPDSVVGHLEFKQGHRTEKKDVGINDIYKDLHKLIDSGLDSLWFHSFQQATTHEFVMLQKFFGAAIPKALGKVSPKPEARIVLAFCAVLEPVAWISTPVTWLELTRVVAGFPIASQNPSSEWQQLTGSRSAI